jgi:hypothetical protein
MLAHTFLGIHGDWRHPPRPGLRPLALGDNNGGSARLYQISPLHPTRRLHRVRLVSPAGQVLCDRHRLQSVFHRFDSAVGWMPATSWTQVAPDGNGIDALASGGLVALSRLGGQVEIYAQSKNNDLQKAWWS